MPFRTWLQPGTPTWLQGLWGARWLQSLGQVKDEWADKLKQAIKVRLPGLAPLDALPYIGSERGLPQAPGEDPAVYAERLRTAWDTWPLAGTPLGLLRILAIAGYYPIAVQNKGYYYSVSSTTSPVVATPLSIDVVYGGSYFRLDQDDGSNWSRFLLVFPTANIPSSWTNIQQTLTGATSPTVTEVNAIRSLVAQWKPAKATFVEIVVITSGKLYGYPVRLYGDGGTYGPSTSVVWGPDLE